jgi:hypothetical protein
MPASLADLAQLSERLGTTLSPESTDGLRGQGLLNDASSLIRSEGLDWVDPHTAPDIVVSICLAVAQRAYKNPEGVRQASVGDVAVTYGATTTSGSAIFLTRQELRAIRRAAGRSAIGSVQMTSDLQGGGDPRWAPTEGDPIPLGPWPWEE